MEAPDRATEIKGAIAAIAAFFTAIWGWLGWVIIIWILAILLDYLSGSLAAKREKNWSSEIARDGLWHKAGEIFAVLVAALCDMALAVIAEGSGVKLPFEIGPMLTPVVLLWYILTEAGSIIENAGRMGAKVPKWFKQRVDNAVDAIDKKQTPAGNDESESATDAPETEPEQAAGEPAQGDALEEKAPAYTGKHEPAG